MFIGLTVAGVIVVTAPLTQAALNPARDLSPRLLAFLAGWGLAALPGNAWGFIIVYQLGPLAGGAAASLVFTRLVNPLLKTKGRDGWCDCGPGEL